ncbi:MAG: ABC transporter ATP-binding protein [Planctomycetes bacterium]|nr:ABC transporter ATP-binding protein [Planctomycetota bacterium]
MVAANASRTGVESNLRLHERRSFHCGIAGDIQELRRAGRSTPSMKNRAGGLATYWDLTRGHRRALALGVTALLAVDLLELLPPYALGRLIGAVSRKDTLGISVLIASGYIGVFALQSIVRYPMRMGLIGASIRAVGRLRERYARHLLHVGREALAGRSTGDLLNRARGDLASVEAGLSTGLLFFFDCIFYLMTIPVAMILISPALSLVSCLALPFIPFVAAVLVRRITQASEDAQIAYGRLVSRAHENAAAFQTVRAFGLEGRQAARFASAEEEYVRQDLRRVRLEILFSGSVQMSIAVGVFVVLLFGGRQAIDGRLSPGQFISFLQYMGMMAWPLTGVAWAFLLFRKGELGLSRIRDILGLPMDERLSASAPPANGAIEVRGLTYSHPGSAAPAIRDLSFSLSPGQQVALMGPTGSGKSTLVDLLTRMIEPPPGTIFFGGQEITTLDLSEFRRRLAVAPQEAFLFSGTVGENIAIGSGDRVRIEGAAAIAQVGDEGFSRALETVVGEKGSALSGGQRQRVALARAFSRGAPVLILDDACSALDGETEEKVFQQLARRAGNSILLFVTHRVRRASEADRILVLEAGALVEEGSHDELAANKEGLYAGWVRAQALTDAADHS